MLIMIMGKNAENLDAIRDGSAFVEATAKRYCRMYSRRGSALFDLDDYRQAAWMGYLKSKAGWDSAKGLSFWGYATIRMRGEIMDQLREVLGRVPRTEKNICYEKFGVSGCPNEEDVIDRTRRSYVPEDLIERVRTWPVMDRILIQLYFLDGLPLKSIGWLFDVSESRICQKLREVSKRLRQVATIHEVHLR